VGTNSILLVGLAVVAVVFVMKRQAGDSSAPAGTSANPLPGATPMGGTPGFGFNLGFFRNEG
jgi:hypothetical protein